jgi:hypothetical protein
LLGLHLILQLFMLIIQERWLDAMMQASCALPAAGYCCS